MRNPNGDEKMMKSTTTVAVAKVVKAPTVKVASNDLTVGEHYIDTYVHLKGTIKKAEDEMADATVSLSVLETLALALKFSGVTGDNAKKVIRETITTALTADSTSKGALTEQYDWLEDEVKALKKDVISKLPKIPKSGKVTTKLTVTEVTEPAKLEASKEAVTEDETETEGVS
jgi:hypothetical protein